MAFTLYIERHPDTLKIVEDFRSKKASEGKTVSQHYAVILLIHEAKTKAEKIEDYKASIEKLEAEVKRLKAIEATAKNFKELMSKV